MLNTKNTGNTFDITTTMMKMIMMIMMMMMMMHHILNFKGVDFYRIYFCKSVIKTQNKILQNFWQKPYDL